MPDRPVTSLDVLASIVKMPGLYWGGSENNFQSFFAFWSGIHMAMLKAPGLFRTPLGCLIPIHFNQFVNEYHGHQIAFYGHDWFPLIEDSASSDMEALKLLLKLRQLYESSRFPALDEEMIRELEATGKA